MEGWGGRRGRDYGPRKKIWAKALKFFCENNMQVEECWQWWVGKVREVELEKIVNGLNHGRSQVLLLRSLSFSLRY